MKSKLIKILSYDLEKAWLNENHVNKMANELRKLIKKDIPMLNMVLIKFYQSEKRNYELFGHNQLIRNLLILNEFNSRPSSTQLVEIRRQLNVFFKIKNEHFFEDVLRSYYAFNNRNLNKFIQLVDFYAGENENDQELQDLSSNLISNFYEKETDVKWNLEHKVIDSMAQNAAISVSRIKDFLDN